MPKRKASSTLVETTNQPDAKKKIIGHWSQGLLNTMKNPEHVLKSDDLLVVIKDSFPKAQFHYLVLPKENITNLKAVTKNHLKLLKHMDLVAREFIKQASQSKQTFKIGYHAEPSMSRLHLHVISTDFRSLHLKYKKHWNSFNTDFFMKSEDVINSLEKTGKITFPSKEDCKNYINAPLKCTCGFVPKNMPSLHTHLEFTEHK